MIKKILQNYGIDALNEMQEAMLKATKDHREVLLLAPTGSGKTLGFLLPAYMGLKQSIKGVQVLIVVPSRELASQIEQVFKQMGTGFKVNAFFGGHSSRTEKNSLIDPPAVLIGTPGRLSYHFRTEHIDPTTIHTVVLDEFDKSLEFGFSREMSTIMKHVRYVKNKVLTSATGMEEFPDFLKMRKPYELNYLDEEEMKPSGLSFYKVDIINNDKTETLFNLLCEIAGQPTLIFFNHRDAIGKTSELLTQKGIRHGVFQGGMEQEDREEALIKFRNGSHTVLLCTDLASRGLDIPEIQNIIHFQIPHTVQAFTHRNGRTARMKAEGKAFFLVKSTDRSPDYLEEEPEKFALEANPKLPPASEWITLRFPYGRKEKINKTDIAGLLYQKGKLSHDELGLIEVTDHRAYATVKSSKVSATIKLIKEERIKNKLVKVEIV